MPGFVGVELGLVGQQLHELAIGLAEGLAGLAQQFGHIATRNLHAHHVLEEISDATVGTVDLAFKVNHQAGQAGAE